MSDTGIFVRSWPQQSRLHPRRGGWWRAVVATVAVVAGGAAGASAQEQANYFREHYEKREVMIPMRDGVELFTAIYVPRDAGKSDGATYPFLLLRTPYSSAPYGEDQYRVWLPPEPAYAEDGYIFVVQDVRGKFMSQGAFVNMRPHVPPPAPGQVIINESTDTFDTIEWLVKNVAGHNGRAGIWGISYPGFYASAGSIDAHPALVAASPQAPIADWWFDDFYHHGAFFLPHFFGFFSSFGQPRPEPTTQWNRGVDFPTPDGYAFYMSIEPLTKVDELYYHNNIAFWHEVIAHPTYDAFWQSRNILPHLQKMAPATLVVGGWFDAEDLYGALNTYEAIEKQNKGAWNGIVMGPWRHGGWHRGSGDHLGDIDFGGDTNRFFVQEVERPFFQYWLKDAPDEVIARRRAVIRGEAGAAQARLDDPPVGIAEATMFETGANRWRRFQTWPPSELEPRRLYFQPAGGLAFTKPPAAPTSQYDEFLSDIDRPVASFEQITTRMPADYMTADQRFASRRPDVLVYQTEPLTEPVTLAGPLRATLWVSTTGTDADWMVKLIDVFPPDAKDTRHVRKGEALGGYQMMVRSEAFRGRFRKSYSKPEPFSPNEPTEVEVPLQDVLHTFEPGHRIMIQVQSTWFPLVNRNPQKYVENIFKAQAEDYIDATHRVYRDNHRPSYVSVLVLPEGVGEIVARPTDAAPAASDSDDED